jgi:hypothetical protein
VHPIELYTSLKRTDPAVNDLWLAQGDVLRKWHERRAEADLAINLNTGAGKTYVGLLIGQSLANETRKKIVYACASIQLVEQTATKARGYGLETTTYTNGAYSNNLFARGEAVLITTYQTLFNGKSTRFRDGSLGALIFDDAHTADSIIRECYTVAIRRRSFPEGYERLTTLFSNYFRDVDEFTSFSEIVNQTRQEYKLVPPFFVSQNFAQIREAVLALDLGADAQQMFAWEWLKDRLDLCCWFVAGDGCYITPPYLPVDLKADFGKDVRRVYLSATLQAPDAFLKTFGVIALEPITAETAAGASERLVLFPPDGMSNEDQAERVVEILGDKKALVLVPSRALKTKWDKRLGITDAETDNVTNQIEGFKASPPPARLVLANRYDGVDLPGDTCRVMVLSGLPVGTSLYERYLFDVLGIFKSLNSTIASRLTQSFGRIFRGMSDYGIVFLTDNRLIEWLQVPQYRRLLPELLQKQLEFGRAASETMHSPKDVMEAVEAVLMRSTDWLEYYNKSVDAVAAEPQHESVSMLELAETEHSFGVAFWKRDFETALRIGEREMTKVISISAASGSWFLFWLATARMLSNDQEGALTLYSRARGLHQNIPRLPREVSQGVALTPQMSNLATLYYHDTQGRRARVLRDVANLAQELSVPQTSNVTEELLRKLGSSLGFESTRPDNEFGTGPDVLWSIGGDRFLGLEAKTDKTAQSHYQKRDLGQLSDHLRWLEKRHPGKQHEVLVVGPDVRSAPEANPSGSFYGVELAFFSEIASSLRDVIENIYRAYTPITLASELSQGFKREGLLYEDLVLRLPRFEIRSEN